MPASRIGYVRIIFSHARSHSPVNHDVTNIKIHWLYNHPYEVGVARHVPKQLTDAINQSVFISGAWNGLHLILSETSSVANVIDCF